VENDWSTKIELIVTSFESGNLPDIILGDTQTIADFADMGVLQAMSDLDPELVAEWEAKFVPETFALGWYKDKFYGWSTYVDIATFLAYNTDMVRKSGVVDDEGDAKAPLTWDELLDNCKTIQDAGYEAISLSVTNIATDMNMLEGIAYANGGRWLDEDGNVTINGPGFVDALQLYADLAPYAIAGSVGSTYSENAIQFFNGQTALYPGLSWVGVYPGILEIPANFSWNLTTFPLNPNPTGNFEPASGIMTGTFTAMITTSCENTEAALEYIDFWSQDEQLMAWNGSVQFGRIPTGIAVWESSDMQRFWPDLVVRYNEGTMFEGILPMPAFPGLNEAYESMSTAVQEVLLGVSDPQTALDGLAAKVEEIIASQ
jgi:multiple sugar transport system substrate-binding protein